MIYTHEKEKLRIDMYDRGGVWSIGGQGGDVEIVFSGDHGFEVVLHRQWNRMCGELLPARMGAVIIPGFKVIIGDKEYTHEH